jgi:hypothetical protein
LLDVGLPVDPDYKGNGLQLQITVEDEGVFTMPWSATVTYRRAWGEWPEVMPERTTRCLAQTSQTSKSSAMADNAGARSGDGKNSPLPNLPALQFGLHPQNARAHHPGNTVATADEVIQ